MTQAQTGFGQGAQADAGCAADRATAGRTLADRRPGAAVIPWLGLAGWLSPWASGLGVVSVARIRSAELGLVSVMPVVFWVALARFMGSFSWAVSRKDSRWPVLAKHLLALVAILFLKGQCRRACRASAGLNVNGGMSPW
jgi:hypothetical protein